MNSEFIQKCREKIISEIQNNETEWRICRINSLVDQILMRLIKCRNNPAESNFIELFNTCIKAILLFKDGEIEIHKFTLDELDQYLNKARNSFLDTYDSILDSIDLNPKFNSSLSDEEIYLKTLGNLNIDDFPYKNIEQIAGILANRESH